MNLYDIFPFLIDQPKDIMIFDTGALIAGFNPNLYDNYYCFTSPGVLSEVKNQYTQYTLRAALENNNLRIINNNTSLFEKYFNKAILFSKKSGDFSSLSDVDLEIFACAIMLREELLLINPDFTKKFIIVTDDYSLQNSAKSAGFLIESYKRKKIKESIQWIFICDDCKKFYRDPPKDKICVECGGYVRKKRKGKKKKKKEKFF